MLIVNVALTGMVPTKKDNPNLPVTPAEIAADALRCYNAGATIFHIHARDENGRPTWRRDIYRDIVIRIRELIPGAIICGSTSGRLWSDVDLRSEVLGAGIDLASLTMGSLNFPSGPSVNSQETIKKLADRMQQERITPELEIFDLGMLDYANFLIDIGVLPAPYYTNFFLGSLGTLDASPGNFTALVSKAPGVWAATGVGKYQFGVNCWAVALGGHVRVGLEDSIWMGRGELATNAGQVERIVKVGRSVGREPATLAEVRGLLCSH